MERKNKSGKAAGRGIILGLVASGLLAAGTLTGVYMMNRDKPLRIGESEASTAEAVTIDLYNAVSPEIHEEPAPAAAPDSGTETSGGFNYGEIVAQEEGLTIYRVLGKRYMGLLAVVDDPLRLSVGVSGRFGAGARGKSVKDIAEKYDAVLAVNGGGFSDPGGMGTGGEPTGNVFQDGTMLWGGGSHTIGMDADGRFYAGMFSSNDCVARNMQWAVSYGPTLIVDGEIRSLDNSIEEPRTAVGQREDGVMLLACIQGRQASALGVTEREIAEIMYSFGAVNAGNLDGGASSWMVYRGEYLNIANTGGTPRPVPTAVIVLPLPSGEEVEE